MRIISPTGKVLKIFKAEPYAEAGFVINGSQNKVINVAKDMSVHPTGIKMFVEVSQGDFCEPFVYIGNLQTEKVQKILGCLLTDGSYDFTKLSYQKPPYKSVVLDGGSSLPYYEEITFDNVPFCNYISRNENDCEEEDELNAEI